MSWFDNDFDDSMYGKETVVAPENRVPSDAPGWHLTKEFMLFQLALSAITLAIVLFVSISGNTRLTRMEVRSTSQVDIDRGQNREIAILRESLSDRLERIESKLDRIAEKLPH